MTSVILGVASQYGRQVLGIRWHHVRNWLYFALGSAGRGSAGRGGVQHTTVVLQEACAVSALHAKLCGYRQTHARTKTIQCARQHDGSRTCSSQQPLTLCAAFHTFLQDESLNPVAFVVLEHRHKICIWTATALSPEPTALQGSRYCCLTPELDAVLAVLLSCTATPGFRQLDPRPSKSPLLPPVERRPAAPARLVATQRRWLSLAPKAGMQEAASARLLPVGCLHEL